ncbi:putative ribonuclease H protein [Platanthera zijinensis]|uniref:Ribonuclease H protein n=1 Tax=Platanthera zijinensis TaxID=2320716 RepID=A0AAP0BE16_9ASPA
MHQRRALWKDLAVADKNLPTILGGDFNCILHADEKRGGRRVDFSKGPHEFANFISLCDFHEIPFTGNIYTWCNNQKPADRVLSRLDRVLLNAAALISFPGTIVHHQTRIGSDHCPLVLEIDKMKFVSPGKNLKFEEAWMVNPNIHSVALSTWRKPAAGDPNKILEVKCARTIKALARWTDAEIKTAVFSFGRNKAPGYDGVTHSFFTHFWKFTMFEIIAAVKNFFATSTMEAKWKDTLVALIPKCSNPSTPDHFRPISLCSTIYKVTAKILANRMKPLLKKLISEEQAAFVPGRLMTDNCLLAQELIHRLHTTESSTGYMAIKIDLEKAFDRMQWSFVERALLAFNFPPQWIKLIMECISFPRFGLLINGTRSKWINATCGLRQGCPLSPYLFILCSDFLSLLIKANKSPGIGMKINLTAPKISHLLFADDTLLFGSATTRTANELANIMNHYCTLSGEAVNSHKSQVIFGPKVPAATKGNILKLLGHSSSNAFSYLGIILRPGKCRTADFDKLLDVITGKIRSWGLRHLSLAGRAALIKSTLSAIPLHAIANTPVPMSVINKINSLMSTFFWSGDLQKHSIHYAKWSEICLPLEQGGLGFKNLHLWRRVLMSNVAARVARANGSFLARTLAAKYKGRNKFTANRSHSKIWKNICLGSNIMEKHTIWMVGNGMSISTLEDCWLGELPLNRWPTFINISALPSLVAELLDCNSNWAVPLLAGFSATLIEAISRLPRDDVGGMDRLIWTHSEKINMNASVVYELECQQGTLFGSEIWKLKTQPRICMLLWRMINNMLPTNDWLFQHRLRMNADCPWGCNKAENISHLLGDCRFMGKIKAEMSRLSIQINISCTNLMEGLLDDLTNSSGQVKSKILASIIYNIWKARNQMIHGEVYLQPATIVINAISDASDGSWAAPCNLENSWSPPPLGWFKINYDGSVHMNNTTGIGCTIRNSAGELIAARGSNICSRSVNMSELRSALLGLSLAIEILPSVNDIILEGDSSFVCSTLKKILAGLADGNVENSIARIIKDITRINISQVNRRANSAADYVANMACVRDFVWERGMPLTQPLSFILAKDFLPM